MRSTPYRWSARWDSHVCISIPLGPSKIALHHCFRAGHEQRVFHVFLPPRSVLILSFHWLVGAATGFSTSHPANFRRTCRCHRVDFGALGMTFSQRHENDEGHNGGGRKSRLGNRLRRPAAVYALCGAACGRHQPRGSLPATSARWAVTATTFCLFPTIAVRSEDCTFAIMSAAGRLSPEASPIAKAS
jgi:hypothetical protein